MLASTNPSLFQSISFEIDKSEGESDNPIVSNSNLEIDKRLNFSWGTKKSNIGENYISPESKFICQIPCPVLNG